MPDLPPLPPGFTVDGAPSGPVYGPPPAAPKPQGPPAGYSTDPNAPPLHFIPGGPDDPNRPGNPASNQQFDNLTNLRKQFEGEQPVQDYKTIIPLMDSTFRLGPNRAGDLNLVYAFGKVMDPGSVVREGEQVMATNVGGVSEKVKGYLEQINGGAGLTPVQRTQLTEEIRNRGRALAESYDQRRGFYADFAQRSGFRPEDVVGPHPYAPFLEDEKGYIRTHGGTPSSHGVPLEGEAPTTTEGHYGDERGATPTPQGADDFRNGLYGAMRGGQIKSPADMAAWTQAFNQQHGTGFHPKLTAKETAQAIIAARQGRAFNVELPKYNTDVSDVRGRGTFDDQENAAVRGFGDVATFGTLDKARAAVGAMRGEGSYDESLAKEYAISDYDSEKHPYARFGGQVIGGLAVPMGRAGSLAELATKGAGVGTAYGVGSSRSLEEVPGNALMGGVAGAVIPAVIGASSAIRGAINARPGGLADLAQGGISAESERASMRAQQIATAGAADDLGIQMPRFVAGGATAQRLGALADQSQIGAPIIRRATNAMLDQAEVARNTIASNVGKAMNHEGMGEAAIGGARKGRAALKNNYRRVYDVAENLSGDTRVPLPSAKQEALSQIAELQDTPGGVQPSIAATLNDIAGKLDGDWTPAGVRRMRTQLRQRFIESGSDQGDASRRAQRVADAAEADMIAGLRNAGKGDAASAWQRASQMRATYQQTADNVLNPILGINKEKTGPEVARALMSAVKNNPGRFREFMGNLPPEELNDVRASIIGQMGNPGSGGQDVAGEAFSLAKFLTHWNDLKGVREQVFAADTVKGLNKLAMVAERAKQAGHVENHSQTGSIGIAMLTAGPTASAPGLLLTGHPTAAMGAVGTSVILGIAQAAGAKMLASPKFAQWLAGLSKATEAGNQNAVKSQIGRLTKLATTNPELRDGVEKLIRRLANDNAPKAGSIAASPDEGPQNQAQPY